LTDNERLDLNFRDNVRRLRADAKLTRRGLDERAGLHIGTIARLEEGYLKPSWIHACRLSRALGVPVEELGRLSAGELEIEAEVARREGLLQARAAAGLPLFERTRRAADS
jgi:transcriptional regulator with XRE-family HTH domain